MIEIEFSLQKSSTAFQDQEALLNSTEDWIMKLKIKRKYENYGLRYHRGLGLLPACRSDGNLKIRRRHGSLELNREQYAQLQFCL